METREDHWRRVSAMAGLDEDGGILPPHPDTKIDQSPSSFWRTRSYADPLPEEDLRGLCDMLRRQPSKPDTLMVSPEQYAMIQMAHDRFGIYAQRQALAKVGLATQVYRGQEWWH